MVKERKSASLQMTRKIFKLFSPVILVSGLYLVYRNVPGDSHLPELFAATKLSALGLFAVLLVLSNLLRAVRLHIILHSGQSVITTFHICNIGLLANTLLPLRAGEFSMATILSKDLPGGGAAALSTLLVDRLLDLMVVIVFFLGTIFFLIPSDHMAQREMGAALSAVIALVVVSILLLAVITLEAPLVRLIRGLGARLNRNVEPFVKTLLAAIIGLRSLFRQGVFPSALLLSFCAWFIVALSYYVCMQAINLAPIFPCAVLAMCFTVAGLVTVPAPGGIGTTHGAIVIALTLYGVEIAPALACAILYHLVSSSINIGFGLFGLRALRLDFGLVRRFKRDMAPPK